MKQRMLHAQLSKKLKTRVTDLINTMYNKNVELIVRTIK